MHDVPARDGAREDVAADHRHRQIGLRSLEVARRSDAWGQSFEFVVNGVPVFAKGANWIPSDLFLARVELEQALADVDGAPRLEEAFA